VEGEGGLRLKLAGDRLTDVKLEIFEPPRLFEAFLRGRSFREVPDIVARICGICPVAYQMSAVNAIEQVFGIRPDPAVRELRRLIYCGEWIESHALHVYMLHAPDFLGYADGIEMARYHPERVQEGLALKKAGNDLMTLLGGREIHPVSVCVGGFYRTPSRRDLDAIRDTLLRAQDLAVNTVRWTAKLPFPDFQQDYEFVALRHPSEYPLNDGRIVSSKGLDIQVDSFTDHFVEKHVAHSTALHCELRERDSYLVGPMARFNLNFDLLSPVVQELARETGIGVPCVNPFQSIIVRSLEMLYACEEALRIIGEYEPPPVPRREARPQPGIGHGCSEAPRGLLYHRYELDQHGDVVTARIVPPTAQNQKRIEEDLRAMIPGITSLGDEQLTWRCEQAVRNYDPCISCSAHFLRTTVERE
jgi:coenzyme F420-reducing hydrogenase alpha subunit